MHGPSVDTKPDMSHEKLKPAEKLGGARLLCPWARNHYLIVGRVPTVHISQSRELNSRSIWWTI